MWTRTSEHAKSIKQKLCQSRSERRKLKFVNTLVEVRSAECGGLFRPICHSGSRERLAIYDRLADLCDGDVFSDAFAA